MRDQHKKKGRSCWRGKGREAVRKDRQGGEGRKREENLFINGPLISRNKIIIVQSSAILFLLY